jgi:ribosome-associated translation inhibitor RaiA
MTVNFDNLPKDVKAYIYQNTNDLEQHMIPGGNLSVVLLQTAENRKFKVKFVLKTAEFAVDAIGEAQNPFDAVKEAKEKMDLFLGDVQAQLVSYEKPKTLH